MGKWALDSCCDVDDTMIDNIVGKNGLMFCTKNRARGRRSRPRALSLIGKKEFQRRTAGPHQSLFDVPPTTSHGHGTLLIFMHEAVLVGTPFHNLGAADVTGVGWHSVGALTVP